MGKDMDLEAASLGRMWFEAGKVSAKKNWKVDDDAKFEDLSEDEIAFIEDAAKNFLELAAPAAPEPKAKGPTEVTSPSPLEKVVASLDDLIRIQVGPGSMSEGYMRGMANGMILARSVMTGEDPQYIPPLEPAGAQPGAAAPWFEGLKEKIASEVEAIAAQREQIVRAFVAQHGFKPDEAEQVVQHTEAGTAFYIRKRAPGGGTQGGGYHDPDLAAGVLSGAYDHAASGIPYGAAGEVVAVLERILRNGEPGGYMRYIEEELEKAKAAAPPSLNTAGGGEALDKAAAWGGEFESLAHTALPGELPPNFGKVGGDREPSPKTGRDAGASGGAKCK